LLFRKVFGRSQCKDLTDAAKASMSVNALARQRAQIDDTAFDSDFARQRAQIDDTAFDSD